MFNKLRLRLRAIFIKPMMETELEEEVRFHLEKEIEQNITRGMSPEEARLAALRSFGGVERVKDESRDERGIRFLEEIGQDLNYGTRVLRRSPGFTFVAVITLALGIGANTAIFSVIDAVLLKMLPVKNPEQLVLLKHSDSRATIIPFHYGAYKQFRDHNDVFSGVLAYHPLRLTVSVDNQPEPAVAGQLVSGNYFAVLGVNAAPGRTIFQEDDRAAGEHPVCVISYNYWQRRFAGDPAVVGKTIHISNAPFTIIGVTPPEFFGLEVGSSMDISVPLTMQQQVMPGIGSFANNYSNSFTVIGRLRPGITLLQAQSSLSVLYQQVIAEMVSRLAGTPKYSAARALLEQRVVLEPGGRGLSELRRQFSRSLLALMGVVALVLAVACANVAGLLLARAVARRKEIAIRLALGISRPRLIRQLLIESVLLSSIGGLLGLLIARFGTRLLLPFLSQGEIPTQLNLSPDAYVLSFTATVAVLVGLLFGLAPAFLASRVEMNTALKNDALGIGARGAHLTFGQLFVIAQVALSLLLLVGSGLFVQSLQNLQRVDAGFVHENVLVMKLEPIGSDRKTPQLGLLYDELLKRVEAIPGVRMASLVGYSPMSRREWLVMGQNAGTWTQISVQGYMPQPGEEMNIHWMQVYPKSFATLGIPLVAGRDFGPQDRRQSRGRASSGVPAPPFAYVGIINESMARRFYGNESPIGQRFGIPLYGGPEPWRWIEIVGVVKDVKYTSMRDAAREMFYLPFQPVDGRGQMTLVARMAGDPTPVAAAIRREARGLDPAMPMFEVETLATQVADSLSEERLLATLSGGFGIVVLLLSCLGLHSILSYSIARRTREIGIRMALGAGQRDILKLVVGHGMLLTLLGVAAGLAAAFALTRLMKTLLFEVSPTDPLTFSLIALLLLAVALLACWIPARRAAKVDPIAALRYE
jgi:predicted permease